MLLISLDQRVLTIALARPDGQLLGSRDASWRVGSGRSLARHVAELLGDAQQSVTALTRIAVALRDGSLTSVRTTLAFVNALAWSRSLEVLSRTDSFSLSALAASAADARQPTGSELFPTYSDRLSRPETRYTTSHDDTP